MLREIAMWTDKKVYYSEDGIGIYKANMHKREES